MNAELLSGPKSKIIRANEHIATIEKAASDSLSGSYWTIVIEADETGDRLVKLKMKHPIPNNLRVIVGEAAHQLRSALDHTAVALASAANVNTRHIYFPFAGSEAEFDGVETQKKVKGIDPGAVALMRTYQPFKGGDDFLWGLTRLDTTEKHKDLIVLSKIGNLSAVRNLRIVCGKIGLIATGGGRLDEGIVVSNLGPSGTMETTDPSQANFEITSVMAFGAVDVYAYQPLVPTLHRLAKLVGDIVRSFEPYVARKA